MNEYRLAIVIDANGRPAVEAINKVTGASKALEGAERGAANGADRLAQGSKRAESELQSLGGTARRVQGFLGAVFGAAVVRDIISTTTRIDGMTRTLQGVLGGGQAAASGIAFIRAEADRLGIAFSPALDGYTRLAAAARGTDLAPKINEMTSAVLQAGRAFNLSGEQVNGAMTAIEQMISKGTVSAEELRGQLGERIPGAFGLAAKAMGVTTAELDKMLSKGEVVASDFLPKFAAELSKSTAAAAALNAASPAAELERIGNEIESIATDIGGGIFEGLGDGLSQFREQLAGINAEDVGKDIGRAIGNIAQGMGLIVQAVGPVVRNLDLAMEVLLAFAGARGIGAALTALKALRVELAAQSLWTAWTTGAQGAGLAADAFGARLVALSGGSIAVAVGALGLLALKVKENWDAIVAAEERGARSIATAQGSIGSGLAGRTRPIASVESDVERLAALMNRDSGRSDAMERHRKSLEALARQYLAAGGTVAKWNELVDRSTSAAAKARAESTQMAQAMLGLNAVSAEAGTVQGKQAKAAAELAERLRKLAAIEKANPAIAADVARVRAQILADYQKEVGAIGKVTGARGNSVASIDREKRARQTLMGIIGQANAGESQSARLRAEYEQQQRRVNDIVARYPRLAGMAAQAQQALAEAYHNALADLDPFTARLRELEEQLQRGSTDRFAADLLTLQIALDEAVDSGDTQRVAELTAAMEQLQLQSGKAASSADVLRDANQRMAEDAAQRAQEIESFWAGVGSSMSDALGDASAQALFHFNDIDEAMSDLGHSLMQTAERAVAQMISEFARLSIINPMLNQIFGTALPTGGSQLGQMFSGQGGGIGGLIGQIGSLFGGPSNSVAAGIPQINVITGGAATGGGSFMSRLGGMFGGSGSGMMGTSFAGVPVVGWIAAAMAANQNMFGQGWRAGGGSLTLPNGQVYHGGSGSNLLGNALTAGGITGLDRGLRGLGLSDSVASLISGSSIHARLFGRQAPVLTNSETTMSLGPDGASASSRYRTLERGGVFRSDRRRWHSGGNEEATQAAEALMSSVRQAMIRGANQMRGEAPQLLQSAIRTVSEYDSKGKIKSTEIFVDILGRTWKEESQDLAASRITAENIIATIDNVLGTTVQATGESIGNTVNSALDAAGNVIDPSGVTGEFDNLIKSVGGSMGEASAIAERWRDDATLLLEGAGFLLAAATDMRNGTALITDGSLTEITNLVETLSTGGETMIETYARLQASTQLYLGALGVMDGAMHTSTAEVVAFAAGAVEAMGGLDAASQQLNVILNTFFTEAERAAYRLAEAQSRATRAASELGVDGVTAANFRQRFEAARAAGLTPEDFARWVRLGVALADGAAAAQEMTGATNAHTASTELYLAALGTMDGAMHTSTAAVEAFAAGAVDAMGGLDAASQQLDVILTTFFTDAERAAYRLAEAQSRANQAASELGVEGVTADNFRQRFDAARALGLTPEDFARWVRLGVALADGSAAARDMAASVTDMSESTRRATEAFEGLRDLNNQLGADINSFGREGMDGFVAGVQDVESWIRQTTDQANALARAAGLQGASEETLTRIRTLGAARLGAAVAALEQQTVDLIESMYAASDAVGGFDPSQATGALALAHQLAEGFRQAFDPQRYQQALQIAQNLFNLGWATGDDPLNIGDRMGVPWDRFIADMGVDLTRLSEVANFDGLVQAARALGVELPELAARLGVNLGQLSDAGSMLNDGFERMLGRLTTQQREPIEALLRRLETAPPGERAGIVSQISQLVNALPAELRALFAPYLDGVDLTPPEEAQITATDRVTTAVNAGNTLLGLILANIARTTPPPKPITTTVPLPGEKSGLIDLDLGSVRTSIESAANRQVSELQNVGRNVRSVESAVDRAAQLLQEIANEYRREAERQSTVGV